MTPQEAIKNLEKPKGRWGTILATTPIVMTVLATVFAGLSSSEMTQAMFHRSLASQQQSKAGDQWNFFQAKRIRGTTLEKNIDQLQVLAHAVPLNTKQLEAALDQLTNSSAISSLPAAEKAEVVARLKALQAQLAQLLVPETEKLWATLTGGPLPKVEVGKLTKAENQQQLDVALEAIARKKPTDEIYQAVKPLTSAIIEEGTHQAERAAEQFDQLCEPTAEFAKRVKTWLVSAENQVNSIQDASTASIKRQLAGGRVALDDYDARRYRQESFYNRKIADMYEVRVWRSGMDSDRHRNRSQLFFYSMLVAQIGVTISSLALAQAKRSGLWFVAALAGLVALGFSAWVYLSW